MTLRRLAAISDVDGQAVLPGYDPRAFGLGSSRQARTPSTGPIGPR